MSWRIVIVRELCKLSFKNGHLIVRSDSTSMIHLSEIGVLMVENTSVSLTSYLLNELMKRKINVIFCDGIRNPSSQLISLQGSHDSSGEIQKQITWSSNMKDALWAQIVSEKIKNQAHVLQDLEYSKEANILLGYSEEVKPGDVTNREAVSAKLYFTTIFGASFNRKVDSAKNSALNYGYTILLTAFSREITSKGLITQIGIHHRSKLNHFNLSSDFMEPYRTIVDRFIVENGDRTLSQDYKAEIVDILNSKVYIRESYQHVSNAIGIYVNSIIRYIDSEDIDDLFHYRLTK